MLTRHIVWAKCCRWWPIVMFTTVGRCGLCGEKPDMSDPRPEKPEDET